MLNKPSRGVIIYIIGIAILLFIIVIWFFVGKDDIETETALKTDNVELISDDSAESFVNEEDVLIFRENRTDDITLNINRIIGEETDESLDRISGIDIESITSASGNSSGEIINPTVTFDGGEINLFDRNRNNLSFPGINSYEPSIEIPTFSPSDPISFDSNQFVNDSLTITQPAISTDGGTFTSPIINYTDGNGIDSGGFLSGLAISVASSYLLCLSGGFLNSIVGSLNIFTVKVDDTTQASKECTLDGILFSTAKRVATEVARDYINWALDGFHGKPLFIRNPSQFWDDVYDRAIGHAIEEAGLGYLCDVNGFKIDISNLLHIKYRRIEIEPPRCTLSDIENNFEDLLDIDIDDILVGNPVDFEEDDPLVISATNSTKSYLYDEKYIKNKLGLDKKINLTLDKIKDKIINIGQQQFAIERLREIDAEIEKRKKQIGDAPTAREQLGNPDNPTSLASFSECEAETNPTAAANCFNVYFSGKSVDSRFEKEIDRQLSQLDEADEIGELIQGVINATTAGILKRSLEEGFGAIRSSGGVTELAIAGANASVESYENAWWPKIFTRQIYHELLLDEIRLKDAETLYNYVKISMVNSLPDEYTKADSDGNFGYKTHLAGNFVLENDIRLSETPGGVRFVEFVNLVNNLRELKYKCGGPSGDRECKKNVTGFIYSKDVSNIRNNIYQTKSLRDAYQNNIRLLKEVYETTLMAHIEIVGVSDDYNTGIGNNRYRENIIRSDYAINRIQNGASPWSLVREAVIDDITGTNKTQRGTDTKVYVKNEQQLALLNSCEKQIYSDGGNRKYVQFESKYIETTCTVTDFENIANTRKSRIPRLTGDLVFFIYRLANESGLIILPTDSAFGILTNNLGSFSIDESKSAKYQLFGSIFTGNSPKSQSENWGALSPREAKTSYLNGIQDKFNARFNESINMFRENLGEKYGSPVRR